MVVGYHPTILKFHPHITSIFRAINQKTLGDVGFRSAWRETRTPVDTLVQMFVGIADEAVRLIELATSTGGDESTWEGHRLRGELLTPKMAGGWVSPTTMGGFPTKNI